MDRISTTLSNKTVKKDAAMEKTTVTIKISNTLVNCVITLTFTKS
jgi:hypothetical protein